MTHIALIGGGLASASAAAELRDQGYDGDVTLFASEAHLPYERPPLSKEVLLGKSPADSVILHDQKWYDEQQVSVRMAEPVRALDLADLKITTDAGSVACDQVLLATGSHARQLPPTEGTVEGNGAPISTLRTLDDAVALKEHFGPGRRLVIIGGGWIGLEAAAAARTLGTEVVLIEALELPLVRVLGRRWLPTSPTCIDSMASTFDLQPGSKALRSTPTGEALFVSPAEPA